MLDEWMDAYGKDVMNLAYAYMRNYHQAQDVTQDVFLKAMQKLSTFRGDSSVKTWLLAITANRCKDLLRSWSIRHEVMDVEMGWQTSDSDTASEVEARLDKDALWHAVMQLPLKYREVIVLYYQRELTSQEVADILRISEAAVRTRLHRGRDMLRDVLERGGNTGGNRG